MYRFLRKQPFLENAGVGDLLLNCLQETSQCWLSMNWEEIEKE